MHRNHKIKIFSIINLGIIYFPYAVSEWCTFLKATCLLFLSAALDFALSATRATIMVQVCTHHCNRLNLTIKLYLRLLLLYLPIEPPFNSTQCFVVNLDC